MTVHIWLAYWPLSSSENGILNDVTLTSSLLSVVQVVMAHFIFLVTLNVKMNYARNYKNLLNFVKVMPKILVVPFFSGHGVVKTKTTNVVHCSQLIIRSVASWRVATKALVSNVGNERYLAQ